MSDAARNESSNDSHSECDSDTDSCLPYRWATQPPQHPSRGRRNDERSTGDVILEDWRARPIAPATERFAAPKSDEYHHATRPDDTHGRAHRKAQRHERALRWGRASRRFSFTQKAHCATATLRQVESVRNRHKATSPCSVGERPGDDRSAVRVEEALRFEQRSGSWATRLRDVSSL